MSISKKITDSAKELKNIRSLVVIAMLLALRVVLGMFANASLPFFGNNVKISAAFLPIAFTGGLFGAVPAAVVGAAGDIISYLLNPVEMYFPGFTISGLLTGLIYGLFFYKNNFTLKSVILGWITNTLLVETFLSAFWLYLLNIMAGNPAVYTVFLSARFISVAIKCIPEILLILALGKISESLTKTRLITS